MALKEELLNQAEYCAKEIEKLKKENEMNNLKIGALTKQEKIYRAQVILLTPTPESIFLEIIEGCSIKMDREIYPNSIFFFKGEDFIFEIENKYVWVSYEKIWTKISEAISGDYKATKAFLEKLLEQHFKIKEVTAIWCSGVCSG